MDFTVWAGMSKPMPHRPAGRRDDRGVDPDDVAVDIERGTAGIALVHRRIDLNVIVIGTGADVATLGGNHARRYGAPEAKRITDRDDPIADPRIMISELDEREIVAIHLDQRKVGLGVRTDDLGEFCRYPSRPGRSSRDRPRGCSLPHTRRQR
jgi:hypothetical protein